MAIINLKGLQRSENCKHCLGGCREIGETLMPLAGSKFESNQRHAEMSIVIFTIPH